MQTAAEFFTKQGLFGVNDLNKWCTHGYAYITPIDKEKVFKYLSNTLSIKRLEDVFGNSGAYVYVGGHFAHKSDHLIVTSVNFLVGDYNIVGCEVNVLDFEWMFNKYPDSGYWTYSNTKDPTKESIVLIKRTGHRKFKKIIEGNYNLHFLNITVPYFKAMLNRSTVDYVGALADTYYAHVDQKFLDYEKFLIFNKGFQSNSTLSGIKDKYLHVVNKDWLITLGLMGTTKYDLYYNEILAAHLDENFNPVLINIPSLAQEISDLPKGI